MTEAEWRAGVDPVPMLELLGLPRTDRRLWAYLVACGRNVLPLLHCPGSRRAVEVMGRYLDGRATDDERYEAAIEAESAVYSFGVPERELLLADAGRQVELLPRAELERMAGWGPTPLPASGYHLLEDATYFASYLIAADRISLYPNCLYRERRFLSVPVLREVFGNPFRPVACTPEWRTSTVVALAAQMYESRDFSAMPILADALQDAGCEDEQLLGHCRGPGRTSAAAGPLIWCWARSRLRGRTKRCSCPAPKAGRGS